MHLTIELPDEQTLALNAKAKAQGVSTEQYVRQVIENDLAPAWLREAWAHATETGTDRLSPDEIEAEIAAARRTRRENTRHLGQ